MSKQSEEKMIILLKEGDLTAFNVLFNAFYYQLYFYCRKYISDPDDAKDLLQNVFLRLWEKRGEIEIEVSLKAYLFRSVHNECLNYIRSTRLNLSLSDIDNELILHEENKLNTPDIETESNEIEREIDSIINKLPEQCRRIFTMSRMKGMKNKEIAKLLSVSVRTVDTQIYRALKVLKKELKEYLS